MLAQSLDLDELNRYENYLLAGGEKKKWVWSSPDKAGTQSTGSTVKGVENTLKTMAREVSKVNVDTLHKNINKAGRAKEWAKITGRSWVYMDPEGNFLNDNLDPVFPPFENTIIIKVDYNGNEI